MSYVSHPTDDLLTPSLPFPTSHEFNPKSCQNRVCIQYPSEKPSSWSTREVTFQPQCANPRDRPSCTWDIHAWKKYMRNKYINTHPSDKRKTECKLHVSESGPEVAPARRHARARAHSLAKKHTRTHTLAYSNWPSSELNKI